MIGNNSPANDNSDRRHKSGSVSSLTRIDRTDWRSAYEAKEERSAPSDPWLYTREMAHRTVNEYTIAVGLLSDAALRVSDPVSLSILRRVKSRLCSAARTQQALTAPFAAGRSDLAEYLQRVCESLSEFILEDHRVLLTLACEHIELDAHRNWRVGIILFELIMNARRHAFPKHGGNIRVKIASDGVDVCCLVADNGSGVQLCSVPGNGSQIVEALATELGGRIDCKADDRGTSVCLRFPVLQA